MSSPDQAAGSVTRGRNPARRARRAKRLSVVLGGDVGQINQAPQHLTDSRWIERAVAAAYAPSRVIVFGSYARGDADEGSDLDLIVVEHEVPSKGEEMVRLSRAIGWVGKGVDVLVYTEREFARRSEVPGTAPYWARREGKVLYDAAA